MVSIVKNIALNIPDRLLTYLRQIGSVSNQRSVKAYTVGGVVRDLILSNECQIKDGTLDLDIVIENNAIGVAQKIADDFTTSINIHKQFGTAKIITKEDFRIDFVTARSETYQTSGALPSVTFNSIKEDLYRRDFSINAIAMSILPTDFGNLLDYTGGLIDLKNASVRTLHNQSYRDDPTRIFRAIRYEQRYNFRISQTDQGLIQNSINQNHLDNISGQRIRKEFNRIFSEEFAQKSFHRMEDFVLFSAIVPCWNLPQDFSQIWKNTLQAIDWSKQYLPNEQIDQNTMLWMALLDKKTTKTVSHRLKFEKRLQEKLNAKNRLITDLKKLSYSAKPSHVYQLLNSYPLETLIFSFWNHEHHWQKEQIRNYLLKLRHVQPKITGKDLLKQGHIPGPEMADTLWNSLARQLDELKR